MIYEGILNYKAMVKTNDSAGGILGLISSTLGIRIKSKVRMVDGSMPPIPESTRNYPPIQS
jgi:hypothetical protein